MFKTWLVESRSFLCSRWLFPACKARRFSVFKDVSSYFSQRLNNQIKYLVPVQTGTRSAFLGLFSAADEHIRFSVECFELFLFRTDKRTGFCLNGGKTWSCSCFIDVLFFLKESLVFILECKALTVCEVTSSHGTKEGQRHDITCGLFFPWCRSAQPARVSTPPSGNAPVFSWKFLLVPEASIVSAALPYIFHC